MTDMEKLRAWADRRKGNMEKIAKTLIRKEGDTFYLTAKTLAIMAGTFQKVLEEIDRMKEA